MKIHRSSDNKMIFRLSPGDDLKESLQAFANEQHIDAAYVAACVGSLNKASFRLADRDNTTVLDGPFEIVSLTGTISQNGSHLHIAISDSDEKTMGGHLMEGSPIFTTAEIVIGVLNELIFERRNDSATGYKELFISRK